MVVSAVMRKTSTTAMRVAPEITRLEEELCFAASRFDQSLLDVFYDQPHHAATIGRRRQDFLDSRGIDVASSGK